MDFIDIHGHYAWQIDDGIPSKEEAIEALDKAKENHITKIIATPHLVCGRHKKEDVDKLLERIKELKEIAKLKGIEIYAGSEVFLNDMYLMQLNEKLVINIENTSYLLCEFDVRKNRYATEEFEDRLYEVSHCGHKVIIAHVERYFDEDFDINRIADLVDEGYIIQVNSTSILGYNGKTIQKQVLELLRNNLVHCIATDTHRSKGSRSPNLLETYDYLKKDMSDEDLEILLYRNPLHILRDEDVEMTHYIKKGIISKMFKRRQL